MRILAPTYFVVGCLMLISCEGDENSSNTTLYARSECIVKFSLDLEDLSEANEVDEALSHFLVRVSIDEDFPIAGFTFPPPRTYHYIQYTDNCESRIEMTIYILDRFYQETDFSSDYTIYREQVQPSTKTIEIRGSSWTDN